MNNDTLQKNSYKEHESSSGVIEDAILVTDSKHRIIDNNKATEDLTGYLREELLTMNAIDFYPLNKLGEALDLMKESQNKERVVSIELIDKNGIKKDVLASSTSIKIEGRQYLINVLKDMSREKKLDKIETDFITIASHQLRTPLTGIKWYCELLLKNWMGELSEGQAKSINQIYTSNNRMINLINDLLSVSRMEVSGKYKFNFKEASCLSVMQDAIKKIENAASEKSIKIISEYKCSNAATAKMDPEKMILAINNVLDNAITYSPNNSAITVGCNIIDRNIIFSVKDQGIGIPENKQRRVFEKFFRADNAILVGSGTGMGLFISKFIIDAHGGKIWFESVENKGTTLYISLPLIK